MRGTSTGTMIRILLVFWATFALHLALPDENQQLEFGDILAVGRLHMFKKPLFTHWAVYVGKGYVEGLPGKNNDEDIFHITGPVKTKSLSDCVFGRIGDQKFVKSNYLDIDQNGNKLPIKSREEIKQKINELHHRCERWKPTKHNCEHVATSIRYGFENCEQKNTKIEKIMGYFQKKIEEKKKKKEIKAGKAGKRSLIDLLDRDSSLAAAGA